MKWRGWQETEPNGQMTASYCRMAATEAMLDCCELEGLEGVICDAAAPPTTCVVECAELWEPLVEDCEEHLQDFQQLTVECVSLSTCFWRLLSLTTHLRTPPEPPPKGGDSAAAAPQVRGGGGLVRGAGAVVPGGGGPAVPSGREWRVPGGGHHRRQAPLG